MMCPHCRTGIHEAWDTLGTIGPKAASEIVVGGMSCPDCKKHLVGARGWPLGDIKKFTIIYPDCVTREPAHSDVPKVYADDYNEACLVLERSPKSAAALGRRCLQAMLRGHLKIDVKSGKLVEEIDEALAKNLIPGSLIEFVHSPRVYGNLAAHAKRDKISGEIVPVEAGEADAVLDVIKALFDSFFVQPEALKRAFAKKPSNEGATAVGNGDGERHHLVPGGG
jgi:hypothetical protein